MDTVKLYQDFERDVDPNFSLGPASDNVIIQYGFPGSGSTFTWQVLNSIFNNVKKTHNCPEYNERYKVVATIRDFRDILCTYFKRANLPITAQSIDFLVNQHASDQGSFIDLYKVSEIWGDKDNLLWLRYEDFFNDFDYLFSQIERFFKIKLTAEQKEHAYKNYSLDANQERVKKADSLCKQQGGQGWLDENWISYTVDGINGMHITGQGSIGKWRYIIPEELHGYVNKALEEPLKRYGYI
jgi:hypothetical protein